MRCLQRRVLVASLIGSAVLVTAWSATALGARAHAAQAPLTPAQARTLSANVSDPVIIVFKDQVGSIPDSPGRAAMRDSAVAAIQAPVLHELAATGSQDVRSIQLINAVAARVSPGEAGRLAANPAVSEVVPDEPIPVSSSGPALKPSSASGITPLPGACPPNRNVQLDPQAIVNIHAAGSPYSAQALGYTGKGVKVAFIADGLDIDNPDFIRPDGQHVFVDYQDFSNTGSNGPTSGGEAFLDASSIAAQGRIIYNIASYGAGLDRPCYIRILGVAPGASLVGLDVFGSLNEAFNSVFLEAVNYAVSHDHVNVLNESFGDNPFPDEASLDLTRMADEAAVKAGVTVDVSTGDSGSTGTIGSPATDPAVISAGATTTYRAYAQTGLGGITYPGVKGWLDNNISGLSSGGVNQDGSTLDVVAPGDLNWALCTPDPAKYAACTNFSGAPASVELAGGTSEAAPLTSGVAALVIQAYEQAHGGQAPTPAVVKQIIVSTAENIDAPADQQGAGMLDAYQAVLAARSYKGSAAPRGHAILSSATQLHAEGLPGTRQTVLDTFTNDGAGPVTVGLNSRTLGTYSTIERTTVTLADSSGDQAVVHFTVPSGVARLDGSIAYVGAGPTTDFAAGVNLSLIDPRGDLAEYNIPQGTGNYGDAQVAEPMPGTWTALIWSSPSSEGGTTGPVLFGARVADWASFGSLSATSLTLAPGASKSVALTVPTPASPGDQAGSIVLSSHAGAPYFTDVTTVPVTVRSLVPAPSPSTTFTGTLTGGNGRQQSEAQSDYYSVVVPAGLKSLSATVTTDNSSNRFVAELIDPASVEADSTAANALLGSDSSGGFAATPEDGAVVHVLDPTAGLWTLAIDFYGQVSGTALEQPFTVTVTSTPAAASAPGLPDSASTQLASGTPVTVYVHVTNNTGVPEAYFLDSRLDSSTTYNLVSQSGSSVQVPVSGVPPEYFVPTHTTSITASASAPKPIYFDYWWYFGDPDLFSPTPQPTDNPTGTLTSSQVEPGLWAVTPFQDGPDGAKALPPVTAATSMTATTEPFDSAMSSPTGDLWLGSIDSSAVIDPYVVDPGQSVQIPLTINPSGSSGTVVNGTVFLDDTTLAAGDVTWIIEALPPDPEGSDVAAFPYRYTVK